MATLLAPMTVAFGAVFPFAVAVGMKTNDIEATTSLDAMLDEVIPWIREELEADRL